jgi:mRNA interferase MazF
VVIVSGSGINADDRRAWMLGVEIVDSDPQDLLAVPLPGRGWADASTIVRVFRRWLVEPVETLDPATVDRIDVALRAVLDL